MVDKQRLEEALEREESNNASEKYVFITLGGLFVRGLIHTRVTPNQLTIFWGVLMFVSSFGFCVGNYYLNIICGICWVIAYALDSGDGGLARYTNLKSRRGDYIDGVNHRMTYPLLMGFIGFSAYKWGRTSYFGLDIDPIIYLIAGIVAGTCMVMIMDVGNIYNRIMPENELVTNSGTTGMEGEHVKHKSFFKKVVPFSPIPFTNMLLLVPVFAVFDLLDVFILFYGVTYFAGAMYRIRLLYKMIPGPDMSQRYR